MSGFSFHLKNIMLVKTVFNRAYKVTANPESGIINTNINVTSVNDKEDIFAVNVNVSLGVRAEEDKEPQINIEVEMVGIFEKEGIIPDGIIDSFVNVNAPAIIFPYIREMVSSLTLKSGIPPVLLAPVNFVELARKKQLDEESSVAEKTTK